jgi:hypothetical protein
VVCKAHRRLEVSVASCFSLQQLMGNRFILLHPFLVLNLSYWW